MATTIDRSGITPTNDTGTPSTPVGDGTLINAAFFALIYDEIDQLFNGTTANPFVFGARLAVEGFGDNTFSASGTGNQVLAVRNTAAGTTNAAVLDVGNNNRQDALRIAHYSTTYTTSGAAVQDGASILAQRPGGLSVGAVDASGDVRIYSGANERARILAAGAVLIGGTAAVASAQLELLRSFTVGASQDSTGFYSRPTFVEAASGTHGNFIGNYFDTPVITDGAAALTNAFNVYIAGAPSVGTNKYALYVAAGTTYLGGTVTLGTAAGFLAYNSVADTVSVASDTTVDFDTESYDDGNVFSGDTFTAPSAGRYVLTTAISVVNNEGATRAVTARFKTSIGIDYYFANEILAASGGASTLTGSIVANLAASETVEVVFTPGGGGTPNLTINSTSSGNALTWFSGRLLL